MCVQDTERESDRLCCFSDVMSDDRAFVFINSSFQEPKVPLHGVIWGHIHIYFILFDLNVTETRCV